MGKRLHMSVHEIWYKMASELLRILGRLHSGRSPAEGDQDFVFATCLPCERATRQPQNQKVESQGERTGIGRRIDTMGIWPTPGLGRDPLWPPATA